MRKKIAIAAALIAFPLLFAGSAKAGDFRIVPGVRIGSVSLGMTEAQVVHLLHAPTRRRHTPPIVVTSDNKPTAKFGGDADTRRIGKTCILDTWLAHTPLSETRYKNKKTLKRDYLSIFFVKGRAVQIEVTSAEFATANGLTPDSSDWNTKMPPARHFYYSWAGTDPEAASPAAKHVLLYDVNPAQGIARKYSAWFDMGADPPDDSGNPETVVVYRPGQRILVNPNDADPFSGTGRRSDPPDARKSL